MIDPDFLAITEKDIFEEARDRLKIATDADSKNRQNAKYALRFREGEQWDAQSVTSASMQSVQLTVNLTDALCTRVVNNIKQQRPRGKCHPVGDGATQEVAEVINGIGRHIEYRSEASIAYDNAADLAATMGWGYWRIVSEYIAPDSFDQDLRILPIFNPFTVYMDPASMMPTGQDADWCLISVKMKRTEYKRQFPRLDNVDWADTGTDDRDDWENKEEVRLAEYFRVREVSDTLYLLRDKTGNEFTRFRGELPSPESIAAAGLAIVNERAASRRRIEWFKLNGARVIDRKVLPGTYPPIFRCQGNARDIDGSVVRRGMVQAMIDPARMVNYSEVAKIKRLALTPKAPWLIAEGQADGHEEDFASANIENLAYLTYKPVTIQTDSGEILVPMPQRLPPAPLEQGFAEMAQGMRANLMAVAGMPNEPGVDMPGQVVSGKAISKRQFLSDQSHYQYYDNLTLAIAQTWRVMLEWIPHYYDNERVQRIIGEDHTPSLITVNKKTTEDGVTKVLNDLSVGRYDVVMDTGPGYETKREEGSAALMDLLKTPMGEVAVKVGPDLIFRSIDAPYMNDMADRAASQTPEGLKKMIEQLPKQAQTIVQQMAAQNQQLQQALQAAQIEIKQGLQKELIKAHTKTHDTQVRADTAEHDRAVDSHTKIAVAEIQAGASLLNTHTEAKYHAAEAERMIETASRAESKE